MNLNRMPMTIQGIKKLEEEKNKLKNVDRPEIIKAIAVARELGDLSENTDYQAAREAQSFTEGRISEIEDILSRVEPIDTSKIKSDKVMFGASVELINLDNNKEEEYKIVGVHEANIENKLISYDSPLGKLLISKKNGDVIEHVTAKNVKLFEIKNIKYI